MNAFYRPLPETSRKKKKIIHGGKVKRFSNETRKLITQQEKLLKHSPVGSKKKYLKCTAGSVF